MDIDNTNVFPPSLMMHEGAGHLGHGSDPLLFPLWSGKSESCSYVHIIYLVTELCMNT